ncbi:MAG: cytidylate kinase-like family protein [Thermoguttaceae bacterium]|jgi:cytidylate kinase
MQSQTHDEPRLVAAAERQMRTWAHFAEHQDPAAERRDFDQVAQATRHFVTIARQAGAGGNEIARLLGRHLGWEVYDCNLLDLVSHRFHEPRLMLDLVDETRSSWVFDVLGTWMDHQIIPHEKFVAHLKRVVATAARQGKAVFVGRGAQFLLPRSRVLAVWITAPIKFRVERIMIEKRMNEGDARQFIREADEGRREFVKRFFHRDINDPLLYDLVINVQHIGMAKAVEQIVVALGL